MKKLLTLSMIALVIGCGKTEKVFTPDNKNFIDQNTKRIELLEINDALQDLRLEALEVTSVDLQERLLQAEGDIDLNEDNILRLFSRTNYLAAGLAYLYNDLHDHVRELERADREIKRTLRNEVRSLRNQLSREIRQRELADTSLQDEIDAVENDLNSFEARQSVINRFLSSAITLTNLRISQLQYRVQRDINRLDNRVSNLESNVSQIRSEIVAINSNLSDMQNQINDVESRLTSVVYPCGESNTQEVLLQTQDGLVAYFQSTKQENISFSDSVTIQGYTIPAHQDKFCEDTNFFNGECSQFSFRMVGEHTIPTQTYNVGDSATITIIDKAYLDVLDDGNYRTTDGYSCNFTISNGELQ